MLPHHHSFLSNQTIIAFYQTTIFLNQTTISLPDHHIPLFNCHLPSKITYPFFITSSLCRCFYFAAVIMLSLTRPPMLSFARQHIILPFIHITSQYMFPFTMLFLFTFTKSPCFPLPDHIYVSLYQTTMFPFAWSP